MRITAKGQVAIPQEVRERAGLALRLDKTHRAPVELKLDIRARHQVRRPQRL